MNIVKIYWNIDLSGFSRLSADITLIIGLASISHKTIDLTSYSAVYRNISH